MHLTMAAGTSGGHRASTVVAAIVACGGIAELIDHSRRKVAGVSTMSDPARRTLLSVAADLGLELEDVGESRWTTMLVGEWKRTIPVLLELDDRTLRVTSLLTGVPDEGHAAVYRRLLTRNQRSGPVHFALDDEGDVILTGQVPRPAIDADHLDQLFGRLLELADGTFNEVLRTGFASYLAAEQRWRQRRGLPLNPVGDPNPSRSP